MGEGGGGEGGGGMVFDFSPGDHAIIPPGQAVGGWGQYGRVIASYATCYHEAHAGSREGRVLTGRMLTGRMLTAFAQALLLYARVAWLGRR